MTAVISQEHGEHEEGIDFLRHEDNGSIGGALVESLKLLGDSC